VSAEIVDLGFESRDVDCCSNTIEVLEAALRYAREGSLRAVVITGLITGNKVYTGRYFDESDTSAMIGEVFQHAHILCRNQTE
jgi:hypothetical protein